MTVATWNRLCPDGRLRPAHTRLDARLSALGITASNAFGLHLSEKEVDMVFQPAARRLTIGREWDDLVSAVMAMTAYRGRARPDRYTTLPAPNMAPIATRWERR
ncbi:hypothetical protein GE21DRAFT_3816 [Neurospora crassa]|uniref:Uncharacterized protein n=1 Tax=Neurospora crassa (strain ATCC 24698 / 74-OR23-1A / CBS 708.71 / DSM 1257 / FGSC 987) TaxID=367110 RepID=Q7S357_NEUCR|nr:hypothetical protein NCU09158 [Neurospora crassa OR74A]EAA29832.1 hypothetical protein NCU09158 [Neurospora crassa OR74A]KHE84364.1 hypothetical protein GE21DRAFT_3816 [Neurospora crassa]|eukprot:XP_959068.1 hypothetical protein NCU09158 [Neurospora crassa OR74A]